MQFCTSPFFTEYLCSVILHFICSISFHQCTLFDSSGLGIEPHNNFFPVLLRGLLFHVQFLRVFSCLKTGLTPMTVQTLSSFSLTPQTRSSTASFSCWWSSSRVLFGHGDEIALFNTFCVKSLAKAQNELLIPTACMLVGCLQLMADFSILAIVDSHFTNLCFQ